MLQVWARLVVSSLMARLLKLISSSSTKAAQPHIKHCFLPNIYKKKTATLNQAMNSFVMNKKGNGQVYHL
jgi:hypothetical protein